MGGHLDAKKARAFQRAGEAFGASFDRAETVELESMLEACAIAKRVRDEGLYGQRTVDRLAKVAGRDRSTVFRFARIADLAPPDELRGLVFEKDERGHRLLRSHWEQFQRVPERWRDLRARTRANRWSASDLRKVIDEEIAARDAPATARDTTPAAFAAIDAMSSKMVAADPSTHALLDRVERDIRQCAGKRSHAGGPAGELQLVLLGPLRTALAALLAARRVIERTMLRTQALLDAAMAMATERPQLPNSMRNPHALGHIARPIVVRLRGLKGARPAAARPQSAAT